MIIILEGCDATGKTTLINQLSKTLSYNIVKGSSFEITGNKTNQELFEAFMELSKLDDIIFDRYIYSNYVYAPLYKDYSVLTEEQVRFIERKLKDDTIVIYLTADTETIKQRFKTRGEEYVSVDKIDKIKLGYERILMHSELPIYKYNTSIISTEEIVEDILGVLNN